MPEPKKLHVKMNNINNSELIDEGLIWFPGPNSYTGEDMAELHVHGENLLLKKYKIRFSIQKNVDWLNQENLQSLLSKMEKLI